MTLLKKKRHSFINNVPTSQTADKLTTPLPAAAWEKLIWVFVFGLSPRGPFFSHSPDWRKAERPRIEE